MTRSSNNDTLKVSNITGWSEYRDGDDLIIYAANGTNFIKVVGAYSTEVFSICEASTEGLKDLFK